MNKTRLLALITGLLFVAGCASTPLIDASKTGDINTARALVNGGADVHQKASYWNQRQMCMTAAAPIVVAASADNFEIVKLLIAKGADVNASDSCGDTPLHFAALHGDVEMSRYLLKQGASLAAMSRTSKCCMYAQTPLAVAEANNRSEVAQLFREAQTGKVRFQKSFPAPPESPSERAAFEAEAKKYRESAVKPVFPEEARRFKAQAEFAFQQKRFEDAEGLYAKALRAAPWWPDGHFNRALILGELARYEEAVREMKRYLLLAPDAPDARDAQDRIYQWESVAE